jgi:hypothetical protein
LQKITFAIRPSAVVDRQTLSILAVASGRGVQTFHFYTDFKSTNLILNNKI